MKQDVVIIIFHVTKLQPFSFIGELQNVLLRRIISAYGMVNLLRFDQEQPHSLFHLSLSQNIEVEKPQHNLIFTKIVFNLLIMGKENEKSHYKPCYTPYIKPYIIDICYCSSYQQNPRQNKCYYCIQYVFHFHCKGECKYK